MDSKAFRLSILAIITTIALIAVVVYAANTDRIHAIIGNNSASEESSLEEAVVETEATQTQYGEQIGDNLKGFLTADDFFDKSEQRPSVVVVVDNVPVPANASSQDGTTDLSDALEDETTEDETLDNESESKDESDEAQRADTVAEKSDTKKPDSETSDTEKTDSEKTAEEKSDDDKSETEKSDNEKSDADDQDNEERKADSGSADSKTSEDKADKEQENKSSDTKEAASNTDKSGSDINNKSN